MPVQLFPHQEKALEETKEFNRVGYFLDMGLGKSMRIFDFSRGQMQQENRMHITQKPIALYEWILKNYAKEGDKILDTHVGSASSLIACHNMGFDYMGCELDEDYFRMATERLEAHKAQMRLF